MHLWPGLHWGSLEHALLAGFCFGDQGKGSRKEKGRGEGMEERKEGKE